MTTNGPAIQRPVLRTDDAFLAEPVHEETPATPRTATPSL